MNIKELYTRFRAWQFAPPTVKPMIVGQKVCLNCEESYDGGFCPRCGQAASTARLTLRNVMSHALDVWGAGNRSMPRNIVHLLLKPGFMIGHYLKGHRQPYFPPFKMLFIFVATFVLLVETVRWNSGYEEPPSETVIDLIDKVLSNDNIGMMVERHLEKDEDIALKKAKAIENRDRIMTPIKTVSVWIDRNRALGILFFQFFVAVGMWVFFNNSPRIGDLSISEQMFVQVFISSQILLISTIWFIISSFKVPGGIDDLPWYVISLIYIIDYKQLFGFSWKSTILRAAVVTVLLHVAIVVVSIFFMLFILVPIF